MNFSFQPPSTFVFVRFTKVFLLKAVHPLKVCQLTKFNGPTLTVASFASTSAVSMPTTLEWLKLQD
jgi:hypothetical protein